MKTKWLDNYNKQQRIAWLLLILFVMVMGIPLLLGHYIPGLPSIMAFLILADFMWLIILAIGG